MRGAGTVITGAGGEVTTGAAVAGGEGTGAEGAAGVAATAATGADAAPLPELAVAEPDEAGTKPEDVLALPAEPFRPAVAAGDAATGGAPAAGTAVGSTAAPVSVGSIAPETPEAPVTLSSTVAGVTEPAGWPLSASAATIADVAAKLRPAVSARDAGAVVPFFFEVAF